MEFTTKEIKVGNGFYSLAAEKSQFQSKEKQFKQLIEQSKSLHDSIGWKTNNGNYKPRKIGTLIKDFKNHESEVNNIINSYIQIKLEFGLPLYKFCELTGICSATLKLYINKQGKVDFRKNIIAKNLNSTKKQTDSEVTKKNSIDTNKNTKCSVGPISKITKGKRPVRNNANSEYKEIVNHTIDTLSKPGGDFSDFIATYEKAKKEGNLSSDGQIKSQVYLTMDSKSKYGKDIVLILKNDPKMEYSITFLMNFIKSQNNDIAKNINIKTFKDTVIKNLVDSKILKMSKDKKRVWFAFRSKLEENNYAIEIAEVFPEKI